MDDLIKAAQDARKNAYAPYSGYRVGAAVRDEKGRVWAGCNVENVSFGATLCAERAALAKMVSEGGKWVREIALFTADGGTPCGICRQMLVELCQDPRAVQVICVGESGKAERFTLDQLLPHRFASSLVRKSEP